MTVDDYLVAQRRCLEAAERVSDEKLRQIWRKLAESYGLFRELDGRLDRSAVLIGWVPVSRNGGTLTDAD
jgi:hypothetical protein